MATVEMFKPGIKKNDQVQVIAGREKGKVGKVLRVDGMTGSVLVEKVNMVKRHVRPNQKNPQGGLVEKEAPLHYSNILLYCGKCSRGVRHGVRIEAETSGRGSTKGSGSNRNKKRVCKRCNESLDVA